MMQLKRYLEDPFLSRMYSEIRDAGALRSVSIDMTNVCNLRCSGCYYFSEGMDGHSSPIDDSGFDSFMEREKKRGTNFITVVGGEPSLYPDRLKKLHQKFWTNTATNGLVQIPVEGLENMPIGVSVWGSHSTDTGLRGGGSTEVFTKALRNYRSDPRVFWYYTVAPGHAHEVEDVVEQCVKNGNYVLFNFYGDIDHLGGALDYRLGFSRVHRQVNAMIRRYPNRILITSYLSHVVTSGRLYDQRWGHPVCTSISPDHEANRERIRNGQPYNSHFRAYNADLKTTRRCCTGLQRACDSCFDVWQHFSWIMIHMKKHLGSKREFTCWLTATYLFYLINRIVDFEEGIRLLPEIHERVGYFSENENVWNGELPRTMVAMGGSL